MKRGGFPGLLKILANLKKIKVFCTTTMSKAWEDTARIWGCTQRAWHLTYLQVCCARLPRRRRGRAPLVYGVQHQHAQQLISYILKNIKLHMTTMSNAWENTALIWGCTISMCSYWYQDFKSIKLYIVFTGEVTSFTTFEDNQPFGVLFMNTRHMQNNWFCKWGRVINSMMNSLFFWVQSKWVFLIEHWHMFFG